MTERLDSQSASPRPARRLGRWRVALLLYALLSAVSLYSIEATHNHQTALDDLRCPVCHVVGHSALDVYTPNLTPVFSLSLLFFVLLPLTATAPAKSLFFPRPQTRAPPALSL